MLEYRLSMAKFIETFDIDKYLKEIFALIELLQSI